MKFGIYVFFEKSVEKVHVSLKPDKNNGYLQWQPIYIYDISINSSQNEKCFIQNVYSKSKHAFYIHYLFPEIVTFMR